MSLDHSALLLLLSAKDKDIVEDIITTTFRFRYEGGVPNRKLGEWATALEAKQEDVQKLVAATESLIRECLFRGVVPAEVLPQDFHPQLGKLITRIVVAHAEEWKTSAMSHQVSPPKLVDFAWRVGTTVSSDALVNMNNTSLVLSLTIQNNPTQVGVTPGLEEVQLELSKQELATMLDGLTKIKEQLAAIK